jgi:uncharacterized membrane protein YagU involved in acid resistance
MSKTQLQILSKVIFAIIFAIIWFVINYLFDDLNTGKIAAITGAITYVLSPKMKKIDSQSAESIQMKWIF